MGMSLLTLKHVDVPKQSKAYKKEEENVWNHIQYQYLSNHTREENDKYKNKDTFISLFSIVIDEGLIRYTDYGLEVFYKGGFNSN